MALSVRHSVLAAGFTLLLGATGLRVGDKDSLDLKFMPNSMRTLDQPITESSLADDENELAAMNDVDIEGESPDRLSTPEDIVAAAEQMGNPNAPSWVKKIDKKDCKADGGQDITDRDGFFKCSRGCQGKRLFWSKNSFITAMQGDKRDFATQAKDVTKDNPAGLSMNRKANGDTMIANVLNLAQDLCSNGGYCLYLDWCDEMNNHHNEKWATENSPEIVAAGWTGSDQGREHEKKINRQLTVAVAGFTDVFVDTKENQGKFCAAERVAANDRTAHCAIVSISFEEVVPGSTGEKGTRGFGIPKQYNSFPFANVSQFIRGAINDCGRACPVGSATAKPASGGTKNAKCGPAPRSCEYSKAW